MIQRVFARKMRSFKTLVQIELKERKYHKRLKYLYFNKGAKHLVILFNGFGGERPKYNYVRGLNKEKGVDRLYILDDFGYKGSYLLFEDGKETPRLMVESLINDILSKKHYDTIIMAGSSKGGTDAMYFGLKFNADIILTGACQYNIGSYLHRPDHEKIFLSMMGENASEKECAYLNSLLPNLLEEYKNTWKGKLYLLYSKNELTYERQIVDLINKLNECKYPYTEILETFEEHEEVGIPFLNLIKRTISNLDTIGNNKKK